MGVIFMPKHMIWQIQQFKLILIMIMHSHTGNVYYGAVATVHVLKSPNNLKKNMRKQHHQLGFTFITSLDVVLLMGELHRNTRKYVTCVNKNIYQINLQKYTLENNSL